MNNTASKVEHLDDSGIRRSIIRDFIGLWITFLASFLLGFVSNEMRSSRLSLMYHSPQSRLDQSIVDLSTSSTSQGSSGREVTVAEMQSIVEQHAALVVDARPRIFYSISHIPSALNIPRDDFEAQYRTLRLTLESRRNDLFVVYCSESDCQDSQMVADALHRLGYSRVRVFRGGWADWDSAHLPEEKKSEDED